MQYIFKQEVLGGMNKKQQLEGGKKALPLFYGNKSRLESNKINQNFCAAEAGGI